jgi:hypothetical protein
MNDRGVPMRGLKPAATKHKIMLQSFSALHYLSRGGGLPPALPGPIFGVEVAEVAEPRFPGKDSVTSAVSALWC